MRRLQGLCLKRKQADADCDRKIQALNVRRDRNPRLPPSFLEDIWGNPLPFRAEQQAEALTIRRAEAFGYRQLSPWVQSQPLALAPIRNDRRQIASGNPNAVQISCRRPSNRGVDPDAAGVLQQ